MDQQQHGATMMIAVLARRMVEVTGLFVAATVLWSSAIPQDMPHSRACTIVGGATSCCTQVHDQQCPDEPDDGMECPYGVNYDLCDYGGAHECTTTAQEACASADVRCATAYNRSCAGTCGEEPPDPGTG
jgi:hypothetical protein